MFPERRLATVARHVATAGGASRSNGRRREEGIWGRRARRGGGRRRGGALADVEAGGEEARSQGVKVEAGRGTTAACGRGGARRTRTYEKREKEENRV
jgi:hypothetical protein